MIEINLGKKVKVKNSEIEGIVEQIDRTHPSIAVRIKITKGRTPVTDYFLDHLEDIQ